jgi:hypothetical protein
VRTFEMPRVEETPMRSQQIPRAEWARFFQAFSERHEEWLTSVRIAHPRLGSQIEAKDLPLEGIVADPDGRGPISIHLGRSANDHIEHDVQNPVQVWVELDDDGAEQAVSVDSSDGTKTILEFRATALPEAVDGLTSR